MEEIISDIGSTPALEPVTDDNILDLFAPAVPHQHPPIPTPHTLPPQPIPPPHPLPPSGQLQQQHDQQQYENKEQYSQDSQQYSQQPFEKQQFDKQIASYNEHQPAYSEQHYEQQQYEAPEQQYTKDREQFNADHDQYEHREQYNEQYNANPEQYNEQYEQQYVSEPHQQNDEQAHQDLLPSTPFFESEEPKRPPKRYTCGFCDSVYPSYRELVEHRACHGGSRPYVCHVCDKRFTQKAHLIIHRRTHTGEKPYSCHICHKRFSQTSHLNSHKRVHTGEKPFFCSLCNMGFCRKPRLEAHLQQHAQEAQQGFGDQTSSALNLLRQNPNAFQLQQASSLASEAAKDFLVSMGLGGTLEDPKGSSSGAGTSFSGEVPTPSKMSVFPGVNMEDGDGAESKDGGEDDEGEEMSRSPTPSQSQRSPTPMSKSRRKPAFVRKLGLGQTDKEENKEEGGKKGDKEQSGVSDSDKPDMSDHAAAVRAMIHMATGSNYTNTEDLMNDLSSLDSSNSKSTPVSGASHSFQNQKLKGFASELSQTKSFNRSLPPSPAMLSSLIRTNSRMSLIDFTAEDLLRHLMSRDDVFRCEFCCVIFHDAAMYHLHRSMHDKMDIRRCNLCGKLATDKYDFTAHFLSQHR